MLLPTEILLNILQNADIATLSQIYLYSSYLRPVAESVLHRLLTSFEMTLGTYKGDLADDLRYDGHFSVPGYLYCFRRWETGKELEWLEGGGFVVEGPELSISFVRYSVGAMTSYLDLRGDAFCHKDVCETDWHTTLLCMNGSSTDARFDHHFDGFDAVNFDAFTFHLDWFAHCCLTPACKLTAREGLPSPYMRNLLHKFDEVRWHQRSENYGWNPELYGISTPVWGCWPTKDILRWQGERAESTFALQTWAIYTFLMR